MVKVDQKISLHFYCEFFPPILNKITKNKKYVLPEIKLHKYFKNKFHKISNKLINL